MEWDQLESKLAKLHGKDRAGCYGQNLGHMNGSRRYFWYEDEGLAIAHVAQRGDCGQRCVHGMKYRCDEIKS